MALSKDKAVREEEGSIKSDLYCKVQKSKYFESNTNSMAELQCFIKGTEINFNCRVSLESDIGKKTAVALWAKTYLRSFPSSIPNCDACSLMQNSRPAPSQIPSLTGAHAFFLFFHFSLQPLLYHSRERKLQGTEVEENQERAGVVVLISHVVASYLLKAPQMTERRRRRMGRWPASISCPKCSPVRKASGPAAAAAAHTFAASWPFSTSHSPAQGFQVVSDLSHCSFWTRKEQLSSDKPAVKCLSQLLLIYLFTSSKRSEPQWSSWPLHLLL